MLLGTHKTAQESLGSRVGTVPRTGSMSSIKRMGSRSFFIQAVELCMFKTLERIARCVLRTQPTPNPTYYDCCCTNISGTSLCFPLSVTVNHNSLRSNIMWVRDGTAWGIVACLQKKSLFVCVFYPTVHQSMVGSSHYFLNVNNSYEYNYDH